MHDFVLSFCTFSPFGRLVEGTACGALEGPFQCPITDAETDGIRTGVAFDDCSTQPYCLINGEAVLLVISRRQGESVWIGDKIKIVICTMRGKRVSLGIAAPKHVSVVRDELKQADLDKALSASGLGEQVELEITQTDLMGKSS